MCPGIAPATRKLDNQSLLEGVLSKKCSVNSICQIKRGILNLKNFQLTVESVARLHRRCFIMLCDLSGEITPHTALTSITCKTKPTAPWSNAFSLAWGRSRAIKTNSHWLVVIGHWESLWFNIKSFAKICIMIPNFHLESFVKIHIMISNFHLAFKSVHSTNTFVTILNLNAKFNAQVIANYTSGGTHTFQYFKGYR